MKPEFKQGQQVTYFPYEEEIPAVIKSISNMNIWGVDDGRTFYNLTGVPGGRPVLVTTSGISIKESELFERCEG